MAEDRIFISIAAYRDPELRPTIEDVLRRASRPDALRFGICRQFAPGDDDLAQWRADPRFKILDVPHRESHGVCWARHRIQELAAEEEFYLQIDSHSRFAEGWDDLLLGMFRQLDDDRAILSSYPPGYTPGEPGYRLNGQPCRMVATRFHPDGNLCLEPRKIVEFATQQKPIPARFLSGGLIFARSHLIRTVPYDPFLYFSGEEISYTLRAFTHGYNLFHPHRPVIWHFYTREGYPHHWDDIPESDRRRDAPARFRQLLGQEPGGLDLGEFGLGSVRTREDYRLWAGVDLAARRLHQDALDGRLPPTDPADDAGWYRRQVNHRLVLRWRREELALPEDTEFVALIVDDQHKQQVFRQDLPGRTALDLDSLTCEFACDENRRPAEFLRWPWSPAKGWGDPPARRPVERLPFARPSLPAGWRSLAPPPGPLPTQAHAILPVPDQIPDIRITWPEWNFDAFFKPAGKK